jgi:aminoglycoside phosphotransferase (APT) family kinase protein
MSDSSAVALVGLDLARLAPLLESRLGAREGSDVCTATLLDGGKSNMTYFVEWGDRHLVLRRPPLGEYDPRSHDISREYRLLTALDATPVPTPLPVLFQDDPSLIGVPFYVMERVPGRVLRQAAAAPDLDDPHRLQRLGEALIDGVVAIHAIHPDDVGLVDLGRYDGYIARQVERWATQWERTQQRSIPALDEVGRRLRAALARRAVDPTPERPYIVHGDYNVGNVIVAGPDDFTSSPVLRAVLDWEMATLGHPLMDLGVLASYNGPRGERVVDEDEPIVTSLAGFPSVAELVRMYGAKSGRDVSEFPFFHVLAFYKVLLITEDVRARFLAGTTVGEGYDVVGGNVPVLAEEVLALADESGIDGLSG